MFRVNWTILMGTGLAISLLGAGCAPTTPAPKTGVESNAPATAAASAPAAKAETKAADAPAAQKAFDTPPAAGTKAKCAVAGDTFTVKEDTLRAEYKGKHYVFCCPPCKKKFDADPTKFAAQ